MKRRRATVIACFAVLIASVAAVLVATRLGSGGSDLAATKRTDSQAVAKQPLHKRFALLSVRHTNKCALQPQSLDSIATRGRLQGSCCQPMDFTTYKRQVAGLTRYNRVAQIPADPYDIPVSLAKQLIAYDASITFGQSERALYDRAVRISHEHGPCCCYCWRWTAFEGQAKFLIRSRRYDADQIATIWNLEDGCGGRHSNV